MTMTSKKWEAVLHPLEALVLHFESFASDLESIHGRYSQLCTRGMIIRDKTKAFRIHCFLVDKNFGTYDISKGRKKRCLES